MPTPTKASKFITECFLAWQKAEGKRRTVTDFALFLGVSRDVLNQWMNGRRSPGRESVRLLSEKLGPEIYDVLGLARPEPVDPRLQDIERVWKGLPHAVQDAIWEMACHRDQHTEAGAAAPPVAKPARKRAG